VTRRSSMTHFDGGRSRGSHLKRRRRRRGVAVAAAIRILAVGAMATLVIAAGWVFMRRMAAADEIPLRVIDTEDLPVVGAIITAPDGATTDTDEDGLAALSFEAPAALSVSAPGYRPGTFNVEVIPEDGLLHLQVDPVIMQGRVVSDDGTGISDVTVRLGEATTVTSEFGAFEFVRAVPGTLEAHKPAWEQAQVEWDGGDGRFDLVLEPFMVRGLRVSAIAASDPVQFQELLAIADETMINTLVFDTKQEEGTVLYDSQVPEAVDIGAVNPFYDVEEVLRAADERGLYTITRIVTFQDGFRGPARPEHAIYDSQTGDLWRNARGLTWMDATDRGSWDYPIALGLEACELGFDEIQFDYVRFPTDGDVSTAVYDVAVDEGIRTETIAAFLAEARSQINEAGCAVSADIFAIVLSIADDQGLGQMPEDLSYAVDAISPMIYPSHYSPGWLGYDDPNDHPTEVVTQALDAGSPRVIGSAVLRPWLQAFYYDASQIREQIAVAEARGFGWMLWNAASEFVDGAVPAG
jgi:hypothetical protein